MCRTYLYINLVSDDNMASRQYFIDYDGIVTRYCHRSDCGATIRQTITRDQAASELRQLRHDVRFTSGKVAY
jgi:hypothetical protein